MRWIWTFADGGARIFLKLRWVGVGAGRRRRRSRRWSSAPGMARRAVRRWGRRGSGL